MIFALIDLYNYKKLKGRFADLAVGTSMSLGFRDRVPADTLSLLENGDVLFTQRLNSLKSWAIMYWSSSEIDHAAVYVGGGDVFHMTLGGARKHSINTVTKGTRVLPVRFAPSRTETPFAPPPDAEREFYTPKFPINKLPLNLQFAWGGLRIVTGFHPERFRWKFLLDGILLSALLDIASMLLIGFPVALIASSPMVLLSSFNYLRFAFRRKRGGRIRYISHPDLGYRSFSRIGGLMFSNLGPLVIADFGALPIGAFLALSREGTDNGTPDELKQIRQRVRDLAKDWGFLSAVDQAEDKQRTENEDK